ncbi:hypothetical protein [Hymenobacter sp. AT01-02]|uniref:hypothetical protein n=1 Tax=Hymenobacter sp. AT01-02 TaxID=1571877 RepID=UPI000AA6BE50|nr:hypothetical protein [Hymenobacter sp. AT01-02]
MLKWCTRRRPIRKTCYATPAGPDAVAAYDQRLAAGPEAFRQGVATQFGLPKVTSQPVG